MHPPRHDIDVCQLHGLGSRYELVAHVQGNEQNQTDVCREEVAGAPLVNKGSEAVCYQDEHAEEQTKIGEVRLQGRPVRQDAARDPLDSEGLHEAQVADADAGPGNEAGDGGHVEQPVEDVASALGEVHVGEETDGRSDAHGDVGGADFVGAADEGRRMALVGQGDEDAAARVHVGVGSGEHSRQENRVDDVGEDLDTRQLGGNDEG